MYGDRVWCVMVTRPIISDDVRDMLFLTAYLMIRGHQKKRKFRSSECQGVATTKFEHLAYGGTAGIRFYATVECESGRLEVDYIVRDRDLHLLEQADEGAWLSDDDFIQEDLEEKARPNPIKQAAHGNN